MTERTSNIKIYKWLLPLSHLYGVGVRLRNFLFDTGVLKSRTYDLPIISVGNITVGGTGKTPHVEYLVRLLKDKKKVAILSRGYKRKSHGYQLATAESTAKDIGDEPLQMHKKFPDIFVAVDKKRTVGIERLTTDEATKSVEAIVLDDAYQHRYVSASVNILLTDFHRIIVDDKLLPAGRLREPVTGKNRANIVIVTKCPHDLKPMEYRVVINKLNLFPYQQLFFTTMVYDDLKQVFGNAKKTLKEIGKNTHVLLVTGIAQPKQIVTEIKRYTANIHTITFGDHHNFSSADIRNINEQFGRLPKTSIIITTEKDAARLCDEKELSESVKEHLYALPIKVKFLLDGAEQFDKIIMDSVSASNE